jgi:hypothetical protein
MKIQIIPGERVGEEVNQEKLESLTRGNITVIRGHVRVRENIEIFTFDLDSGVSGKGVVVWRDPRNTDPFIAVLERGSGQ